MPEAVTQVDLYKRVIAGRKAGFFVSGANQMDQGRGRHPVGRALMIGERVVADCGRRTPDGIGVFLFQLEALRVHLVDKA